MGDGPEELECLVLVLERVVLIQVSSRSTKMQRPRRLVAGDVCGAYCGRAGGWDTAGTYPRVGRAQDLDLAHFELVALELLALLGRDPRPAQADGGTNSETGGRASPERGGQSVRSVAETRGAAGGGGGGRRASSLIRQGPRDDGLEVLHARPVAYV